MKRNGIFSAKSLVTLASVISVLLMFSFVCAGVLFVLNELNIVYFPFDTSDETKKTAGGDPSALLPLNDRLEISADMEEDGVSVYEKLVTQAPFTDSFYMKLRVENQMQDTPYTGIYEIWRFGKKYRINRYNLQDEVESILTCDGERVQLIDFSTLSDSYYLIDEGFFFEDVAPFPDFRSFFKSEYEIFEYSETEEFCNAVCEYPSLQTVDITKIYKDTGLPASYSLMKNGKTVLTIETVSLVADFAFNERMFDIER